MLQLSTTRRRDDLMCFSAQASFVAAGSLTAIGIASLHKANRSTILLACIPLIFAIQQLAEGVIWLGPDASSFVPLAKTVFLAIAFLWWPLYIPLSLFVAEKNPTRRFPILMCGIAGAMWAVFALYHMLQGTSVALKDCHIYYLFATYNEPTPIALLYFNATIIPFLIASEPILKLLGIAAALSCVATYFIWYSYFISIWCFFAAVLSLGVYTVIKRISES